MKTRLIPSLLLKNGRCVKGVRFGSYKDVGSPVTSAKVYEAQGADELLIMDIHASRESRTIFLDIIKDTAEQCFMPLTVGGAVATLEDMRLLLISGADKVSVNTAAFRFPDLISDCAKEFGSQSVMSSIDYKFNGNGVKEVYIEGGTVPTGVNVCDWAKTVYEMGAGEILLTSIDHEGMMKGCDVDTIKKVVSLVKCPVIAGGGVGTLENIVDAVNVGNAAAVSASSIFHFTDQSVIKCHSFMRQSGLDVRI